MIEGKLRSHGRRIEGLLPLALALLSSCGERSQDGSPPTNAGSPPTAPRTGLEDADLLFEARDRGTDPFAGSPAPAPGSPATLVYSAEPQQIGTFEEGTVTEVWFWLRNAGASPLTIDSMRPSCACTEPRLIRPAPTGDVPIAKGEAIPGGAVFLLNARFASIGEPGPRTVHVQLRTNDPANPDVKLLFQLVVEPWYTVEPPLLTLPELVPSRGGTCSARIATKDGRPLTMLPRPALAAGLSVLATRVSDSALELRLKVEPLALKELISTQMTLYAAVGEPPKKLGLRLPVHVVPTSETVVSPSSLDFGEFRSSEGAKRTISVRCYQPDFEFTAQEPRLLARHSEFLKVTTRPFREDDVEGVDIDLEILPGCPVGTVTGALSVETNLEAGNTLRVPIVARIRAD